jgi:hypothetical protein
MLYDADETPDPEVWLTLDEKAADLINHGRAPANEAAVYAMQR